MSHCSICLCMRNVKQWCGRLWAIIGRTVAWHRLRGREKSRVCLLTQNHGCKTSVLSTVTLVRKNDPLLKQNHGFNAFLSSLSQARVSVLRRLFPHQTDPVQPHHVEAPQRLLPVPVLHVQLPGKPRVSPFLADTRVSTVGICSERSRRSTTTSRGNTGTRRTRVSTAHTARR